MPVPHRNDKHDHEALVTPDQSVERVALGSAPPTVVLCFHEGLYEYVETTRSTGDLAGRHRACTLSTTDGDLGVVLAPGVGAPMATLVLEELIARGTRRVVVVGTAGGLAGALSIGDTIVVDRALRDEGTSYHYVDDGPYAHADPAVTAWLEAAFDGADHAYRTGGTWTTDAPFRETVPEIRTYREEGLLTVDMEAAAVFSVATYRDVEAGAVVTISDLLDPEGWTPRFEETQPYLEGLIDVVVDTVAGDRDGLS